ncbi:MAG: alpha/beta hydrolase fold domain-containing protein [Pseudomonadota bacterium]
MSSDETPYTPIADQEVLAFIERTEDCYPDGAVELSIVEQRALYDRMAASFRQPRPGGTDFSDLAIGGPGGPLHLRSYRVAGQGQPRVLYFHGGGFVVGGLDSHDDVCAEIAARCHVEVISTDYRLCPEHPHPAAYDDALAVIAYASDRPIILAGDSAGANLVAAAALTRPAAVTGQVLIYPGLGGEAVGLQSYRDHANAPLLTTEDVHAYHRIRHGGAVPAADPTSAPLMAEDFYGLAPCFVSSAEVDPLRDDGIEYVRRLQTAGVKATVSIEAQLPHGYLRARATSARAKAAFDRIIDAIVGMAEAAP